jgi:3-methylcrotonyl-CoA carboxylase alpha subunit
MGSKSAAKALMEPAGVPLVPGYHGTEQSDERLAQAAAAIGYPILIKASAGGGGKGMHIITGENDLATALASARREAASAFGDDRLLIEKYLADPRHIEVQVFADRHGNVVHLFERDCSIQRRHQKLIEEAPAPGLTDTQRQTLGELAIKATRTVNYVGAGTIEFVASEGNFYFIEMNTRLQVEHVATEMITGLDLVEWQLRVAAGEKLPLAQKAIRRKGHAIEVRLYAEDPGRDFLPAAGKIGLLRLPPEAAELRIETGLRQGDAVTPYYDALIAKLIAWGENRSTALQRLQAALAATKLAGVASNRDFLTRIVGHSEFAKGAQSTGFIEHHRGELMPAAATPVWALIAASLALLLDPQTSPTSTDIASPWQRRDFWRLLGDGGRGFRFRDGDEEYELTLDRAGDRYRCDIDGRSITVKGEWGASGDLDIEIEGERLTAATLRAGAESWVVLPQSIYRFTYLDPLTPLHRAEDSAGKVLAPMPGKISAVLVTPEALVKRGQILMQIEAMKMELAITAPDDGVVTAVHFAVGALVDEGTELVVLRVTDAAENTAAS